MSSNRAQSAYRIRVEAAELARHRPYPTHAANADEQRYAAANYPMSFTKGLKHSHESGLVDDATYFEAFRSAIDEGFIDPFTTHVPVPKTPHGAKTPCTRRQWEAPTAGIVYDLEGPDAQAVTMAPAPELGSDELAFEMAEIYELALLRDESLASFASGDTTEEIQSALGRLNALPYAAKAKFSGRPRKTNSDGELDGQTVFRGSSPGVEKGSYLSQFLLIGSGLSPDEMAKGKINYGAQQIDQRVQEAKPKCDYMQDWNSWLTVQDGFDVNSCDPTKGENKAQCSGGQEFTGERKFICTPRDLATYVHFDALYQAYLNATLLLLEMRTPFDPGFARLSGMRDMFNPMGGAAATCRNAGGFALYGGPHILSLVTEVATRALKATRFQKFNNHLRLRPEALAARIHKAEYLNDQYPSLCGAFLDTRVQIDETVRAVEGFNKKPEHDKSALLPMAFAEGSPMHPTYGAGHAAVAGACTTIVKAFFDTGTVFGINKDNDNCRLGAPGFYRNIDQPIQFQPIDPLAKKCKALECVKLDKGSCPLTLEGELNKLAANISIGRNMAGVHYFSDYFDSLRMGERVAIGMLEEQALCYPTDNFVLSVPTFDGEIVRIGRE